MSADLPVPDEVRLRWIELYKVRKRAGREMYELSQKYGFGDDPPEPMLDAWREQAREEMKSE